MVKISVDQTRPASAGLEHKVIGSLGNSHCLDLEKKKEKEREKEKKNNKPPPFVVYNTSSWMLEKSGLSFVCFRPF